MLKFKALLWAFTQLLGRQIKVNPSCAAYVSGKELTFQIQTRSGVGRHYTISGGKIRSKAGLTANPDFTLIFAGPGKGFSILSAKDSQAAFLRALGSKDLVIDGNFLDVMWFQGLTNFLQPPKEVSPYDRTRFLAS